MTSTIDAWLSVLLQRHTAELSSREFLRAVRALSARYVERRASLSSRSPIDTAGKRAAFAAFYAPLHFFTVREALRALGDTGLSGGTILDLGCGTGVASAAWASASQDAAPPSIIGVDQDTWALSEAAWNWRTLGLGGRTRRGNMIDAFAPARERRRKPSSAIVLGWSVNEIAADDRSRLLAGLLAQPSGTRILVLEPLATSIVPWWNDWARAFRASGGRADEWKFANALPPPLVALDEAAGFRRETLGARTLWLDRTSGHPAR